MLALLYTTKKALKASIGQPLHYRETSMFTDEYKPSARLTGVGPSEVKRNWYATVTVKNGLIVKVI